MEDGKLLKWHPLAIHLHSHYHKFILRSSFHVTLLKVYLKTPNPVLGCLPVILLLDHQRHSPHIYLFPGELGI